MSRIFSFVLFFTLFSLTSFAQVSQEKKGWTSTDRHDFVNECIKSAKPGMGEDTAKLYCYCMQEKMEKKYPDPAKVSTVNREEMEKPEWQTEISNCLAIKSKWTAVNRSDFLTDCIKSATPNLGEEKAKNYCNCTLVQLEKKYSNPDDAAAITEADMQTPDFKKMVEACLNY